MEYLSQSKICTKCHTSKSLDMFSPNARLKDGKQSCCKECYRKYKATPKMKEYQRRRYNNRNEADKVTKFEYHLLYNYGITIKQRQQIFDDQGGCCKICGRHETEFKIKLAVDHCHKTNKVRGLLCSNCNHGIGNLRDSIHLLESALRYLKQYD